MTTKLGQSQSNGGGNNNEMGQRENTTWQAITIDREAKTDKREKANLCGGKHQDREIERKIRKKDTRQNSEKHPQSETACILTIFSTTMELLY